MSGPVTADGGGEAGVGGDRSGAGPLVLTDRHTGERLELRRLFVDGEECLEIRGSLPPRSEGPPLHVHYLEDEEGRVEAGVLTAQVGGEVVRVEAGGTARLPRDVPHRWWNEEDEELRFVGLARPVVDLDRYLQAAFEVVNAGPPGRPPLFWIAHVMHRHRRTQAMLQLPWIVRTLLVPLLVGLGTALGKYRGAEWPGAPGRCPGAPPAVPS